MQVNPYLFYNGNCEEALKYYQKGARRQIEAMHPYEGGPAEMPIPPDWKKKLMHARITIDGEVLMASDAAPGNFSSRRAMRSRCRSRSPPTPSAASRRWPMAAA